MTTILQDRLEEVLGMALDKSSHESIEKGMCVMEAVSYIAGEPWAAHPQCTCPILTTYAININDRFNDEDRQKLKPLIPMLVGTRATLEAHESAEVARKRFIMWRNVTITYPLILDFIKATDYAKKLRSFTNTLDSMAQAKAWLLENREAIREIASADADASASAYANVYAYVDASANASAYANVYAYVYAYANAYANVYANAYAYIYVNAIKKLRSQLADIAVETLRLAIDVKE